MACFGSKLLGGLLLVLGFTAALDRSAFAETRYYPPHSCVSLSSAPMSYSDGASGGVPVSFCPANAGFTTNAINLTNAFIAAFDYSSNSRTSCFVVQTNWNGNTYLSSTKYSCGTWGGCNQDTNQTYTGSANLNIPVTSGLLYPLSQGIECNGSLNINGYNVTF